MFTRRYVHVAGIVCIGGAFLGGVGAPNAIAEAPYPNRLIRLIHPYTSGGPTDIVARAIGEKLSPRLKQPIIIENRPGAGGNIGTEVIAKAAPDGYTLGLVLNTTLTVNPSLYGRLPFDPEKDFRLISILTGSGMMLVVHPSVPVNSVAEFVAYAKAAAARKEPITYASGGNGTPGHLTMENFRMYAGFEAIHVPYRGNAPLVVDLVAGQIKFGFVTSAGMMEHVRAGRLKGLAVSRLARSPLAPDVPTIAESGYPGFEVESYNVLLAPAGLPDSIAALLECEFQAVLRSPDFIERLRAMDLTPIGTVGRDVAARLRADRETWAKVVAAAHMQL